jgi:hypothetical protein
MNPLPEDTPLGTLEFRAIYGYFDGPYLFSAQNRLGQTFIAIALPRIEGADGFLFVPVSEARLVALEARRISPYIAFAEPEEDRVFEVRFHGTQSNYIEHRAAALPHRFLPGETLQLPNVESSEVEEQVVESVLRRTQADAIASQSDILRIGFRFPGFGAFQAPLGELGAVLESLQETVNALGQRLTGQFSDRGRIADTILDLLRLRVVRAYASSFGVEVSVPANQDLFEPTLVHHTLERLISLLSDADTEQFGDRIRDLNKRSISKLREFLESVIDSEVAFGATLASPLRERPVSLDFDVAKAKAALSVVLHIEEQDAEVIIVPGALMALNARNWSFEFLSLPRRRWFRGKVGVDAPDHVLHARIQSLYEARIMVVTELSTATGEETERYRLLDLTNERLRDPDLPPIDGDLAE